MFVSFFRYCPATLFVQRIVAVCMDDKLLQYFVDPIKGKIMLEVSSAGTASVKYLCERCPDVPRSTMYRHLSKLEKEGLLEVVSTRRVRGTVEKTYRFVGITSDYQNDELSREMVMRLFAQYCMKFFEEFENNLPEKVSKSNPTVMAFTAAPVFATDDEMMRFTESVGRMISALSENKATEDRNAHTVGFMITPPKNKQ